MENITISKALRINEQIRITPIRVIDHEQNQLGVIPTHEAMARARDAGLDLVEVSPMERPPVCRIMDYGKFKYESKKRQKASSAGHAITLKEIRLRPKTDTHDRELKVHHAEDFLAEGHKVQFTMLFKGRERFHQDIAQQIFAGIIEQLGEKIKVERNPMMEGRRMTLLVSPTKAAMKPGHKPQPHAGDGQKEKPKDKDKDKDKERDKEKSAPKAHAVPRVEAAAIPVSASPPAIRETAGPAAS